MAEEVKVENKKPHNKYLEAELIIGGLFFLTIDGVCALIDVTGVGLAIAPVIQAAGTGAMTFWGYMKRDSAALKTSHQITKYALNLLPLLPTLFTSFVIQTYIHNHPKLNKMSSSLQYGITGKNIISK